MKINLNGQYVRQEGNIFPWEMVKILNNNVSDSPRKDWEGAAYWSSKLAPYGNGQFYARVANGRIQVFNKKTNKKVATIFKKYLFYSNSVWVRKVMEMGYLNTIGAYGLPFGEEYNHSWERTFENLQKVARGKPALYHDGSPFLKVSKELMGTELIQLDFGSSFIKENFKVFTFDGAPVEFEVEFPLSKKHK